MSIRVPAAMQSAELVVKKSRFIAWAAPADTREAALAWLSEARAQYPDAGHHCWAYLLGAEQGATQAAANDDGEPGGTAGKPILNVIQHKGISNVVVIVIRYFGGVKLGAGGLVRAYAGATEAVLSQTQVTELRPHTLCVLECDFANEQALRHFVTQQEGVIKDASYHEGVTLKVSLDDAALPGLQSLCASLGAGLRTH